MTADNMIKEIETIENIRYKLSCLFTRNKFTANNKISTTEYTAHKDNKHYMINVNSDASYTCIITSNVVEFEQAHELEQRERVLEMSGPEYNPTNKNK